MTEDNPLGSFGRFGEPDPNLRDLFERAAAVLEQKTDVTRRNAIVGYLHQACGDYAEDLTWQPSFPDLLSPIKQESEEASVVTHRRMIELFSRISKRFHTSRDAGLQALILAYLDYGLSDIPRYPDYRALAVARAADNSDLSANTFACNQGVTQEVVREWHFQFSHGLVPGFMRLEKATRTTPL